MHATTFDQKYACFNEIWEDYIRERHKRNELSLELEKTVVPP